MSYWVLFLIIEIVAIVNCIVAGIIIENLTNEDGDVVFLPTISALFIIVPIGVGLQLTNIHTYRADSYDLEAIYAEYESAPNTSVKKDIVEINRYDSSWVDKISIETLIGGRKKVTYTVYVPSEKALEEKDEWEKIESFRLKEDTESKPSENAESNQNEERE